MHEHSGDDDAIEPTQDGGVGVAEEMDLLSTLRFRANERMTMRAEAPPRGAPAIVGWARTEMSRWVARHESAAIFTGARSGVLVDDDPEPVIAALKEVGARLVHQALAGNGEPGLMDFVGPDCIARFAFDRSHNEAVLTWQSCSGRTRDALVKVSKTALKRGTSTRGDVWGITAQRGSLELSLISRELGRPLVRENYNASALQAYDRAIGDLASETPRGRLVVVDGPTGTGKTWMLRGMLAGCPRATFVICQPGLVPRLTAPELIPLLLEHRASQNDRPLVFIVEDGDEVLVPRQTDNLPHIQAMLNLADGLLSASLDLRAIVTTNAEHLSARPDKNIDQALLRHGRQSARITVGKLPTDHALSVLRRLVTSTSPEAAEEATLPETEGRSLASWTLADIYEAARDQGWVPPPREGQPQRGRRRRTRRVAVRGGLEVADVLEEMDEE